MKSSFSASKPVASAAALALLFAATGVFAQQTPPAASPLSPSPNLPTAPAPPSEPSAASVALAREVIVASGLTRSFEIIVPQFLDQIGTTVTRTRPDLIRDLNTVMEQIKPEFDKQTQDVITNAARSYAQRLNDKQLKDISDFFKSPSGVAYVAAQPQIMGDLFSSLQGFSQRLANDMMTRVREEMKKRGHDI